MSALRQSASMPNTNWPVCSLAGGAAAEAAAQREVAGVLFAKAAHGADVEAGPVIESATAAGASCMCVRGDRGDRGGHTQRGQTNGRQQYFLIIFSSPSFVRRLNPCLSGPPIQFEVPVYIRPGFEYRAPEATSGAKLCDRRRRWA